MGKLGKAFTFLLAVMLLLTATSRAAASFTVAQVSVEAPQARRIVHTVMGDGVVEKMDECPVYAPASVLVDAVCVQEGQSVKKGGVLAQLDMKSIEEARKALADEIEKLRLSGEALAANERRAAQERSRAHGRAQEDYERAVSGGALSKEAAEQQVEDAREKLADAKRQAGAESDAKLAELAAAEEAAKSAYESALEQEESALLAAKRTLEDAGKTPADDYGIELLQLEITQKQRKINELYRQKWEDPEDLRSINDQITALQNEITALDYQLKEKTSAAAKAAQERAQALARAQEDYDRTAEKYAALVRDAKQAWDEAQEKLDEFMRDAQDGENASVKAAREALEEAKRQEKEQERAQEEKERQAKRALEDASAPGAADGSAEINRIAMEELKRQLALLDGAKQSGGEVTAQIDGTVTLVQLTVGQKTPETAAFLMSDTSGGMRFTTQVSKEDAAYVAAGDAVSLKSGDQTYEDLAVLSLETNEDETVKVTVYVPGDTLSLGARAGMELSKQSEEYSVTVPLAAVYTQNEKNFVYVMEEEDTVLGGAFAAVRVDVTVAEKNGMFAALEDCSLTEESQVITDSDHMISAGETVRLREG